MEIKLNSHYVSFAVCLYSSSQIDDSVVMKAMSEISNDMFYTDKYQYLMEIDKDVYELSKKKIYYRI